MSSDELEKKAICFDCVGDKYLSEKIQAEGRKRTCSYCKEKGKSFPLEHMANIVEQAFDIHYSSTATEPDYFEAAALRDPESNYSWERHGDTTVNAIMDAADISEEAALNIQQILSDRHADFDLAAMGEETPFSEESYYEEIMPGDDEWQESWRNFEKNLKSEARFFSRTGVTQLAALFGDIDTMYTRKGQSLIVIAGPGTKIDHLFRARVFQSDYKLAQALKRPDRELAAPPSSAATAGRMNAKGISTFYGATDANISLAEVRPPVGSQVLIGRFEIIRPLRLLDLNQLTNIQERGSIFDPTYAWRLGRMMFLRSFCQRVSKPVMPDDQDFEYITTQAIADYLATESKVPLDGILFPSVQAGGNGLNAVLFHKASKCEEMDIPNGTEIEASTASQYEDEWVHEYTVIERVLPEKPKNQSPQSDPFNYELVEPGNYMPFSLEDEREPALKLSLGSMKVHIIESMEFKTVSQSVARIRLAKTEIL